MTRNKRLLAVFAHPDDEAFGPSGTIARYVEEGIDIRLLCATKGESGQQHDFKKAKKGAGIGTIREEELRHSAKTLGVPHIEFLDFLDGSLCNANYHALAQRLTKTFQQFRPDVVITFDQRGISGHLDHIAVSMVTTYVFLRSGIGKKLYYHCLPKEWYTKRMREYFVYFPEGYSKNEITTIISIEKYWDKKVAAMMAHTSQSKDAKAILKEWKKREKTEHFILYDSHRFRIKFPETDLFVGI